MTQLRQLRTGALVLAAAAITLAAAPRTASAQDFFSELFGLVAPSQPHGPQSVRRVGFHPGYAAGQIIVSFTDRKLYYVSRPGEAIAYPIATPRPGDAWQGVLPVTRKAVAPAWRPTAEMRRENPRLPAVVPGGHPHNPLGTHALYLGSTLYRIHGTDAPWTIGQPVSRGCIRMHNAHAADLFQRVGVGTRVTVTYRRFASRNAHYW